MNEWSELPERLIIRVRGGFEPRVLVIPAGAPHVLEVRRESPHMCADRFVMPALQLTEALRVGEALRIALPPLSPGQYEFSCAFGMKRGRLIAR